MKKARLIQIFFAVFLTAMIFISCKKNKPEAPETVAEPVLPETPYDYYSKHTVDNNIATLGRVLFYDKSLSVNNAVACGSCHKQEFAFADNVKFNKGFNGIELKRNSPSIQGIRGFSNKFGLVNGTFTFTGIPDKENENEVLLFWDGRQRSVSNMVLNPVLNHKEMNLPDFETLINKLKETSYYPTLFKNAFGYEAITKENIAFALEGFIACLNTDKNQVSNNNHNNTFEDFGPNLNHQPLNFSSIEEQGKFLFHIKYNCATCHDPSHGGEYGTVTSPSQMFNIGLDQIYADNGLGAITQKAGDKGLFKVPTLKNISLTAPYMHDGRFANLAEVIDHYSHNIQPNENLSPQFLNLDGTPKKLNILPVEKQALIAFLNTLKDNDFLTSPMYADPFKK